MLTLNHDMVPHLHINADCSLWWS